MKLDFPHVTHRVNADGTVRYYFRRRGVPITRLPDDPHSEEFAEAYKRMCAMRVSDIAGKPRHYGTLAWLCDLYQDSPEFGGLAPSTQKDRARILAAIQAEPIDPKHPETFGQEQVSVIAPKHITVLRNRKREKPNAANERLKVLSQVFQHGFDHGHVTSNPVVGIKKLKTLSDGHRTATDAELAQYLAFHQEGPARLAIRLLMTFGMRVGDLRMVGRRNVIARKLVFETGKSQYTTKLTCSLPIPDDVYAELMAVPHLIFLLTSHGKPFASDKAISQRVSKWFKQAGVEKVTAHSVRKWLATKKAEEGWTEYQMMAFFGWNDPKEARPYIQKANREKLAARDITGTRV
jgi:integrase